MEHNTEHNTLLADTGIMCRVTRLISWLWCLMVLSAIRARARQQILFRESEIRPGHYFCSLRCPAPALTAHELLVISQQRRSLDHWNANKGPKQDKKYLFVDLNWDFHFITNHFERINWFSWPCSVCHSTGMVASEAANMSKNQPTI